MIVSIIAATVLCPLTVPVWVHSAVRRLRATGNYEVFATASLARREPTLARMVFLVEVKSNVSKLLKEVEACEKWQPVSETPRIHFPESWPDDRTLYPQVEKLRRVIPNLEDLARLIGEFDDSAQSESLQATIRHLEGRIERLPARV